MSDVKVYFLGEEYSVPEELKEFIGYLHYFEEIHNEIMPLLTNQIPKKEFTGGADVDFEYFKAPLSKIGEKVIAKLAEKNIFDVTLNDIVYNNKGYIQLYNICKDTTQGMVNILMNAMQTWLDEQDDAYSSATSNITGSGVSIWTSRLSSALIYSALEASTLKKQVDKADKQYRAAMKSLSTNINDAQEKQKTELLVNKYYPGAAEAIGLFVSEMMEYYVCKLERHGIFDYSKVKGYDLQRSSDLLKNITLVSDKVGLLKEAFTYCPYNPDIYNAAMENGLADVRTFETAKYFMQDGILVDVIYNYIIRNIDNYNIIDFPLEILSYYKHQEKNILYENIQKEIYIKNFLFVLEKQKDKIEKEETTLKNYGDKINKLENDIESYLFIIIISFVALIISLPLTIWAWNNSEHGDLGIVIVFFAFVSLCSIVCIVLETGCIIENKNKLTLARQNLEEYKRTKKV